MCLLLCHPHLPLPAHQQPQTSSCQITHPQAPKLPATQVAAGCKPQPAAAAAGGGGGDGTAPTASASSAAAGGPSRPQAPLQCKVSLLQFAAQLQQVEVIPSQGLPVWDQLFLLLQLLLQVLLQGCAAAAASAIAQHSRKGQPGRHPARRQRSASTKHTRNSHTDDQPPAATFDKGIVLLGGGDSGERSKLSYSIQSLPNVPIMQHSKTVQQPPLTSYCKSTHQG